MDCPHIIADEDGKTCLDCGEPIENPEFSVEFFRKWGLELRPLSELGDWQKKIDSEMKNMGAIFKLAKDTIKEYDDRATWNEDPQCPTRPKLRFIGGLMTRIPFEQIWREIVEPSYYTALGLGFKGTESRWSEIVKESREN